MIEGWGTVGVFLKTEMKAQTGVREKERQIGVITERGPQVGPQRDNKTK
jgi:hypothetical protein